MFFLTTEAADGMKTERWTQKSHLFRADEYICPVCGAAADRPYKKCPSCGTVLGGSKKDSAWVEEAESIAALMDDDW